MRAHGSCETDANSQWYTCAAIKQFVSLPSMYVGKRPRSDSDVLDRSRHTSPRPQHHRSYSQTRIAQEEPLSKPAYPRKRQGGCADSEAEALQRRKRQKTESLATSNPVSDWVLSLPQKFEPALGLDSMSRAPSSKRARSDSSASELSLQSDGGTDTTGARGSKSSIYANPQYSVILETKGSFMREAEHPLSLEERGLVEKLKNTPIPHNCMPMPDSEYLCQLRDLLQDRSELQVCIELHPYLVPSAEILAFRYPEKFKNLIQGYNVRWLDNIPLYKKLPQPDRTVGFSHIAFTEIERRKLQLAPETASLFVARHGILFPFFTAEVKCGREGLETADRANTNSMTIALRAVVELYRRAGEVTKVHREILGFSISHNHESVRIYGHYPEISGDTTTYYRTPIRRFFYADDNDQERETAYRFVWNMFTIFAPAHLKCLKETIGRLRDPLSSTTDATDERTSLTPTLSGGNVASLTPVTSSSNSVFVKPGPPLRHNSATVSRQMEQQRGEIMAQFEQLQRTSGQQQQEAKEREHKLLAQLEQLRKEAKEREDKLQKEAKEREDKLQKEAKEREDKLQKEAKEREDKLLTQFEQLRKEAKEREDRLQKQHTQLMTLLMQKTEPPQDAKKT